MNTQALALAAAIAILGSGAARAADDNWVDHHDPKLFPPKTEHVVFSAAFGAAAGALVEDRRAAFALALAPGVAKEIYDRSHGGKFNWLDIGRDAAGALVGVQLGHWAITRNRVSYTASF